MNKQYKRNQEAIVASDYQMPGTGEVEETLLGELVNDPSEIKHVALVVRPEMFSEGNARKLWTEMLKQDLEGKIPDMVSLRHCVDVTYLADITTRHNNGISFLNVMNHAGYLRLKYFKQRSFVVAHDLLKASCGETASEEDIINIARNFVTESEGGAINVGVQNMTELGNELAERLQGGNDICVRTGFPKLDRFFLGGFPKGALVILAGRPGYGKTSVACFMMKKAAEAGSHSIMFSLEQTNIEVYKKLMYGTGHLSPDQIASGQIEWKEYENGVAELIRYPILLDDSSRSVEEISCRIATLCRQGKCDIAYIDYLGLIPARPVGGMTKSQAIGEITHRLKNLAKDLRIPIVLLCQLNRDMAKENRPPVLTDLRDSGDIEQDADKVLMINRKETENSLEVELWVRKNRQGRAGEIMVRLHPDDTYTNFYEIIEG